MILIFLNVNLVVSIINTGGSTDLQGSIIIFCHSRVGRARFHKTFYGRNLLIFASKAGAYPSKAPPTKLANIRLGWKGLPGRKTLAYYIHS